MSSYFQAWGSLLTTCPDPSTYDTEPAPVVGRFPSGKPVAQGYEQGICTWINISLADYIDLWDTWDDDKDNEGTFVIPHHSSGGSWTSWRSVTAWAEEPIPHYEGRILTSVSMRLIITGVPG